jgi:DICT domain-containing protein
VYALIDWKNVFNIFSERRALLAHWSKTIEEAVIDYQLETDVFAGFQHLHFIVPILIRYQQLQQIASSVWLFGTSDERDPALDGFRSVILMQDDLLVREWFLVVDHPRYARAIVAREITPPNTKRLERKFQGVLTSDRKQIKRLTSGLQDALSIEAV